MLHRLGPLKDLICIENSLDLSREDPVAWSFKVLNGQDGTIVDDLMSLFRKHRLASEEREREGDAMLM